MMATVTREAQGSTIPLASVRVLLPVKELAEVKLRLAAVLTREERRTLVLTMLRDVLAAVREAGLAGAVLSPDPGVLAFARGAGATIIEEHPRAATLSAALERAIATAYADASAVLVILPDTPLVTAGELATLIAALPVSTPRCRSDPASGGHGSSSTQPFPAMVLAPDRARRGTNALLACPPAAVPLGFGTDSLARHIQAAEARGVANRICRLPGLGLDVDDPDDLAAVSAAPGATLTQRFLRQLHIPEGIKSIE
jgi:2-phospho-L-lactate guanylyltransferase (CobY/MobA/RfbA family)